MPWISVLLPKNHKTVFEELLVDQYARIAYLLHFMSFAHWLYSMSISAILDYIKSRHGFLRCFICGKKAFIITSSSFSDLSSLDNLAVICPLKQAVITKHLLNTLWQIFLNKVQALFYCMSGPRWDAVMKEIQLGFVFFFKLGDYAYFIFRL